MPCTVADESKSTLKHFTIGICVEQLPGAPQTLGTLIEISAPRPLRPLAKRHDNFIAAREPLPKQTWRQLGRDTRQMRMVDLRIGAQRARQPAGASVEPLTRACQQFVERRQRT